MSKNKARKRRTVRRLEGWQSPPVPPPSRRRRNLRSFFLPAVGVLAVLATVLAVHFYWTRRSAPSPGEGAAIVPASAGQSDEQVFAAYAGSAACQKCHSLEYEKWSQSHHALAERAPQPALDAAAFEPSRSFKHGTQVSLAGSANGTFQVTTRGLSGGPETHAVVRVIGHDPLRQFLVKAADDGRLQTLEASYDPAKNEWFDVYGDEDRQPGEWGHWTGRGMTWNSMCAGCHNTRLRKNYDESADAYHTTMAEMSVGCEACHGPMANHVRWQHAQPPATSTAASAPRGPRDPTIPHFTRDQHTFSCAGCHSRRTELTGDFVPGEPYLDHFAPSIVDGTSAYYPDGQVHEEDYEFSAFMGSKMYAAGVRCVDCHEPHAGKTILAGKTLCLRCHAAGGASSFNAPLIDPAAHTHHDPAGAGGQCINCHMPQTVYMQRHHRHDHGFTVPDPVLTQRAGIPNACNRCHADRDAAWAAAAANKWYGARMDRPSRSRALTVAAARNDEDAGKTGLLAMLDNPSQSPYWKAVADGLLGLWAGADPAVADRLSREAQNSDPLVRATAARSLRAALPSTPAANQAVRSLLDDPVRIVRVAAADVLRAEVDTSSPAGRDLLRMMAQSADQPAGQLQAGTFILERHGNADDAVNHLQKAAEWDKRSAALRRELAVIYSSMGRPQDALAQISEACRIEPDNAGYQYLAGLAYSELGQKDQTMSALERAVRLDPRYARAWYNLGLARNDAGHPSEALEALAHAQSADPTDPQPSYAAATILLRLNRPDEARAAAGLSLKVRPGYAPAIELLRSLSQKAQ